MRGQSHALAQKPLRRWRSYSFRVWELQAFGKCSPACVETCCIIPKWRVSRIRHHVNLCVSHLRLVLVDDGWFDDRVLGAMRNQHRLADPGQEIVVVERARE